VEQCATSNSDNKRIDRAAPRRAVSVRIRETSQH
jgi:hypothetical protein